MTDDSQMIARLTAGTHALIDLDAYANNIHILRDMLPGDRGLMAVIKANAYGHGATQCAAAARAAGAEWIGVARTDEALRLRAAGDDGPLLVLGPPNVEHLADAAAQRVTIAIGSRTALDAVRTIACNQTLSIHLKIDTGMRRYGFLPDEVVEIAKQLALTPNVSVDGIFTHFAMADELDPQPTQLQLARFESALRALNSMGLHPACVHAANSAGILTGRLGPTTMARSGIATFGLSPSSDVGVDERFKPVLSIRTQLSRVFEIRPGEGVSYGWSFRANRAERAGDVPFGYADGLPRALSNAGGWVSIAGERCAILGRVCMDQMVVRVPEGAHEGDSVSVLGAGGMTADDIGRLTDTLNYDVLVRLAARVPRVYLRGNRPVAWSTPADCANGCFA